MDATLVVMAAGMGSRFGGLKQMTGMGPSGETLAEYSVYDAIRAGFTRVVFIIKPEMREDFEAKVIARFAHAIRCDVVYQTLADIPAGCALPEGRTKPWGTAHAVWSCRHAVREPFAVINADDYYGPSAFAALYLCLTTHADTGAPHPYCMAAYALRNTLSENGSVSRGVCEVDAAGSLRKVVEMTRIERRAEGLCAVADDGALTPLAEDVPVSLNTWGFYPSLFAHLEEALRAFLAQPTEALAKAECYLPEVVGGLLRSGQATVRVLPAQDHWIGVTYPQDKEAAQQAIRALVQAGKYPESLWHIAGQ